MVSHLGQHHTDAGPVLDVFDMHPDPNDALARELFGRVDRGHKQNSPPEDMMQVSWLDEET